LLDFGCFLMYSNQAINIFCLFMNMCYVSAKLPHLRFAERE
jgi:hypothetical protein